ncbi:hypothetical protein NC653_036738 [Populus alba x Populus x berolinensis]|uniref:Uncharacterized protein n=1 Tax=Populus alba x Populus x berolinensis TaxID=444605 RepID=A0AAD6LN75_9ROSI|nr:hypothetical protein NC653_036725 [Populus alba x Populus x berolinensis]KAJ6968851.1 hypothetical protein NC653_036738 [Populus alba x Populus x berolinensis]
MKVKCTCEYLLTKLECQIHKLLRKNARIQSGCHLRCRACFQRRDQTSLIAVIQARPSQIFLQ